MNNAKDSKKNSKIRKENANNTENNLVIPENDNERDEAIMKELCGNKEIYRSIISQVLPVTIIQLSVDILFL